MTAAWTSTEDAEFRAIADGGVQLNGSPAAPPDRDSWQPVDLRPILEGLRTGTIVVPIPTLMERTDGVALLYRGEVHSFAGEPESGKSWAAAAECARLVLLGEPVLYLDFEDNPASVLARLLALGATPEAILASFTYIRPDQPGQHATIAALAHGDLVLVVIDGLSEAYVLMGLDPEKNVDAAKFLAMLPRPIAAAGAAVIQIDHVTKAREGRGRYAIGAQHKLAGIAVAYSFEVIKPFSRIQDGTIKIRVEKDRHGHVRGHAEAGVIAVAHVQPHDDGERVAITLGPPDGSTVDDTFRPVVLMERVSRALEAHPGLTKRAVRETVTGRAKYVDLALDLLVADGFIRVEALGQANHHHVDRPFREADDADRVPVSPPCPDRVRDTGETDRVPVSPPIGDTDTGHTPVLSIVSPPSAADRRAALAQAEADERRLSQGGGV
jgi:hypothetical protein